MQPWVDFRAVKASVTMRRLLEHYGITGLRTTPQKGELRGACPIHKGTSDRSFHVNLERNIFRCFKCKAGGNVIDFVAKMEGTTAHAAAVKLAAEFVSDQKPDAPKSDIQKSKNPPLGFSLRVDRGQPLEKGREFSTSTLEFFGAGICRSKGIFSGRFIVPLHDPRGELVGYVGHSMTDEDPELLFPPAEKGFWRDGLVFNLHRILESGAAHAPVLLVDEFFACMKLTELDVPAVSLMKNPLSEEQEFLLGQLRQILIVIGSGGVSADVAGEYAQRLSRRSFVRVTDALAIDDATPSRVVEVIGW